MTKLVNATKCGRFQVTVRNWTRDEKDNLVDLPNTQEWVEIEIDFQRLAQHLGTRALRGKRGFCAFVDGCVIVRKAKEAA